MKTSQQPPEDRFTLRLPATLLERIRQIAVEHKRSINQEMVWALEQYAHNHDKKHEGQDDATRGTTSD
jgi:hypothetical protein